MERKLSIGTKLRILRVSRGKSSGQVARSLYLSQPAVSRAEHDRGEITVKRLEMFCKYYKVSLKNFFDSDYWKREEFKKYLDYLDHT